MRNARCAIHYEFLEGAFHPPVPAAVSRGAARVFTHAERTIRVARLGRG